MTANRADARAADPFDSLPLLILVPQAAKLLGISRAAVYRFASAGDLPTKRLRRSASAKCPMQKARVRCRLASL